MPAKVFIDGDVGTTGLQIRARLEGRSDLTLLRLPEAQRKDATARSEKLAEADVAILCLPDDAARQAAAAAPRSTRIIDASTAHRTAEGWAYGLPELRPGQSQAIAAATRVSNPGCYPTGAVALLRPLIDTELLPADAAITINAVSGYSGGGRSMIAAFEGTESSRDDGADHGHPVRLYGLSLEHKHVEEMRTHSGLVHRPLFVPSVGRYRQGMLVSIPLQLWSLPGAPTAGQIHAALADRYAGAPFIDVLPLAEAAAMRWLDPEGLNGTNQMRLHVFANEDRHQALLVALLDNLGKGASGAAVQSLNLMLGAAPDLGVSLAQAA